MKCITKISQILYTIAHHALGFETTILKVTNFAIPNQIVKTMKAHNNLMYIQSLRDKMNYLYL